MLKQYGRDLTDEARRGLLDPMIGRHAVLHRVLAILLRRTKNNPILLGDPGVGKTAVAEGLAHFLVSPLAGRLQGRRLIALDVAGMLAGTQYRGSFEERMHGVIAEVQASWGQVILFVDEVHMLVGAGQVRAPLYGLTSHHVDAT